MISDVLAGLKALGSRLNDKKPVTIHDLCIIDESIKEINRLRDLVAIYEAKLYE